MRDIMSIHEIVLPETEPETEWILGRAVQKVSPYRTHARLQGYLNAALLRWEKGHGQVAPEWRFRIAPPGEIRRPLVPDVAFVSDDRLRGLQGYDLEVPPFAPDVAVEILSPGYHLDHLRHKIAVYLGGGASLVVVVDPAKRTVTLHDRDGARVLSAGDVLEHAALPAFRLPLAELFSALDSPD
jgi:Uma2 family endonuclease